jgi:hypothetical protein
MILLILFIIIIFVIIYYLIKKYVNKNLNKNENKKINLDDLEIIKRPDNYQKLIEKLIDDKKYLFTDDEIEIMKNKFQFYETKNGTKNITDEILKKFYFNIKDDVIKKENFKNNITINENIFTNVANNDILNGLNDENIIDCDDVEVLKNPNYLKNYYYDMYGNRIKASLKEYINDYYIRIDNNNNEGQKVEIIEGKNNFIIPDQYHILKYQTNAYNIDWNRIINPLTVY